jgi:hypothetical protein
MMTIVTAAMMTMMNAGTTVRSLVLGTHWYVNGFDTRNRRLLVQNVQSATNHGHIAILQGNRIIRHESNFFFCFVQDNTIVMYIYGFNHRSHVD